MRLLCGPLPWAGPSMRQWQVRKAPARRSRRK